MFQIYLLLLIKSQSDGRDFLRDHSEFILSLFSLLYQFLKTVLT